MLVEKHLLIPTIRLIERAATNLNALAKVLIAPSLLVGGSLSLHLIGNIVHLR